MLVLLPCCCWCPPTIVVALLLMLLPICSPCCCCCLRVANAELLVLALQLRKVNSAEIRTVSSNSVDLHHQQLLIFQALSAIEFAKTLVELQITLGPDPHPSLTLGAPTTAFPVPFDGELPRTTLYDGLAPLQFYGTTLHHFPVENG